MNVAMCIRGFGSDYIATPPNDPIRLHAWFKARPGSEQIATAFALRGLAEWVSRTAWQVASRERRAISVGDVGHGIGTTIACIAWWAGINASIVAIEDNPWCQEQAKKNLGLLEARVLWYSELKSYLGFDLLCVDGPQITEWACLAPRAVAFFEGGRRDQRAALRAWLRSERRPFCEATWRPKDRSKGFTVIVSAPTGRERVWFACVRVREHWRDLRARMRGVPIGKRRRDG